MAKNNSNNGPARKSAAKKEATPKKAAVKKTAAKEAMAAPSPATPATSAAPAKSTAPTKAAAPAKKVAAKKAPAKKAAKNGGGTTPGASPAEQLASAARPSRPKQIARAGSKTARETQVVARVDIGFGNTLYVRGNGPGLSWDSGVAMQNSSADEWTWTSRDASSEFEVKLVLNDEIWETGPNTTVPAGEKCVIEPVF